MNKRLLRSVMLKNGDTGETLSKFLGISRSRLSCKMNERVGAGFTQKEIRLIIARYDLTPDEVINIFFAEKVS